ncbi:hypothetical protein BHE74_00042045 [Ensete ventricosum]|nr:hypothetical protein GW17_00008046 [Ensete ventricosum]RWW51594.1 hypothetical protein BHE74_00042045 [Ensete ventricosum]RZS04570.1 hypothetical protein BHM03_00034924 [Ensete ventricosum]
MFSFFFQSRRKRARTPTPGNYLGLKNPRDTISCVLAVRFDRGRSRGGHSRDDYDGGYRRSPRHSPYRGGRDYSPHRSPYGGRSRKDRSRSPRRSPDRGYGRRANGYAR